MKKNILAFDLDGTLVKLGTPFRIYADPEIFEELSKKYTLALITGSSRDEAFEALQIAKLFKFFEKDLIITANVIPDKKSGRPFKELQRRASKKIVMIGDAEADKIGATKANMPFIIVKISKNLKTQKENLKKAIQKATTFLESP